MEIMHHIAADWDKNMAEVLQRHGIVVAAGSFSNIQVVENETYSQLKPYFEEWKVVDMVYSKFTKKELNDADWLILVGLKAIGYPQPEAEFGYLKQSYSSDSLCDSCGIGEEQIAPIVIKSDPKPGKNKLFQLHWIHDEIFADKDFYTEFLKPTGIKSRPVLTSKSNQESESVVQLILSKTSQTLAMNDHPFTTCKSCGIKKYSPKVRGFFPSYNEPHMENVFVGREYFGDRKQAFNRIFIKQELKRILQETKAINATSLIPLK